MLCYRLDGQKLINRVFYGGRKMEELRLKIETLIEEIEDETQGRHMNDTEYSRWTTLQEVLEIIDEISQ